MRHTHAFPVDPSQDAADAWAELTRHGRRVTFTKDATAHSWAYRVCDGGCERLCERVAGHP